MNRTSSFSVNANPFCYAVPKGWKKYDLAPSKLLPQANLLVDCLLTNDFSFEELIQMRQNSQFCEFYKAFHEELEQGTGVVFLPHLDIMKNKNKEKRCKFFLDFCQFIGEPVPINKEGEILREVKNIGIKDSITKPARGHLTNQSLAFHSDRADITALLCESLPFTGGEFKICSSANLFYALQDRPDILEILSHNIPHDLRDEGTSEAAICNHPIMGDKENFWVRYIRKFIDSTVRHGLTIDKKITDALDYIDTIINKEDFYCEISFKPGDLIMFNNHLTLHSRNAFADNETNQRNLFRIWLSSEFSRPLPESLKSVFHSVEGGSSRGGIR